MTRIALALILLCAPAACKKKPPEAQAPLVTPDTPTQVPEAPVVEVPDSVRKMMNNFERVYFELDSHTLSEDAKAALAANVEIMQSQNDIKIEVEGHADERGTTDYNVALGQKRADAVKTYMTSLGVSTDRVAAVSYGEERPAVSGSGEAAWSKNRRAEFRISWGSGASGTTD